MVLARFLKQLITTEKPSAVVAGDRRLDEMQLDDRPRVLNVGGGNKSIPIPAHYAGWNHLLLDIDPRGSPDVVCDARELELLEPNQFDAIYCSHNLEHYYKHEGAEVLKGFLHVLKPDGFAEIAVPDLKVVMRAFVERNMEIEDILYVSPAGPIAVRDVLYGWGVEIERSGDDFYAHKTGFTPFSLNACLEKAGFRTIFIFPLEAALEVRAFAFKAEPTVEQRRLLGLGATAP
jgi:SAM-dependent methyltransferase